ncbi:MAG: DegT/DnrJ/EryC1/StrS family aminotransferase, partial [Candidatus Omnitrophica bacterium]|nr:DegT/DnrJ/EryC1/StrS family aminotransferase [Candidatus Omnitrophota bacterium]
MANEKNLILPSDPKANYLVHKEEIDSAIHNVLDSGKYILGQQVRSFEKEFADYLDLEFAIGVGSGTEALHLALLACGIKSGDTVITVSHTAVATVAAIELSGAKPFLVDIDELSYNMDPVLLEKAIVENVNRGIKPKAVVAVHLYGYPANMPEIIDIAKRYDFRVIEDCAQSHGASIGGKLTGSWSDIAAFSFYPTKNLSALGDAGAVVTSDHALVEKVRLLREYGWKERYFSDI